MRVNRSTAFIAAFLLAACTKPAAPQKAAAPAAEEKATDDDERASLLELAHGATVVARTGEALLEFSALRAVDGDPGSFWLPPPHDLPQSMIVALPARSRIEKVGIRTVAKGGFTAKDVTFEVSTDGQHFAPPITITSVVTNKAQWFDVQPVEATHLGVTMVDSAFPPHDVRLYSVLARGIELEPPRQGDIAGCWSVNGRAAAFTRTEGRVAGVLEMGREPIRFEGGADGRLYRLSWIRGNDYGLAAITVSPDGAHLSGAVWHEEAIPLFFADSWFGERRSCGASPSGLNVAAALLRRVGRFSLFGLRFRDDGSLDTAASRDALGALSRLLNDRGRAFRIVAHEYRQPTRQQNRDFAERELAALRRQLQSADVDVKAIEFVARGSEAPRQEPATDLMRALYSSVDLEIQR